MIDAHAGGLGCLGGEPPSAAASGCESLPMASRLALIAGTSTCHMASSEEPVFVPGVWGPYSAAMIPGMSLNEGGQTAAGAAIDFVVETHAAFPEVARLAAEQKRRPVDILNDHLKELTKLRSLSDPAFLTTGLFVGPDFNGCRSPLADPHLRGSVIGLGPPQPAEQANSVENLCILYLATLQGLAYSTRSMVEAINNSRAGQRDGSAGTPLETIRALFACGGLARNSMYLQAHADALGLPVMLPAHPGAAMPLGCAMLAATAAGTYGSVPEAMRAMGSLDRVIAPNVGSPSLKKLHDVRYEIFRRMQKHQQEYLALEQEALAA
mmetsp:Transcript_60311/g.127711  ORF Transcript_60311/g.127711 Transcript_60311/m.127711 type:complete len:324 (+) Transcript_60311:911-1882(+)